MPVVEGYTFAINMQDRGVVASLRQMKTAASAMKAEMRAGFETIRLGEGSLSAYNYKLQESERQIQNYRRMQSELRKELKTVSEAREKEIEETGKATDKTEKQYDKLAKNISNYQHQINRLRTSQRQLRTSITQLNSGLQQNRQETVRVKDAMTAYVNELKSEGRMFKASKAEIQSYKAQHQALVRQYHSEASETDRLRTKLNSLQGLYSHTATTLNKMERSGLQATKEYQSMGSRLNYLKGRIRETNAEFAKQNIATMKVRTSVNNMSRTLAGVNAGGITRVSRAMDALSAKAMRNTSHIRAWASSLRGGMMGAAMAVAPLGMAMGAAVKQSAELGNEWVQVKNYLYTGADSAKEARYEVSRLSQIQSDAKKYSNEYGYSQKEIAEQYGELVKRGYNANQSIGAMKSMMEAARASGDDFGDVIKNSTNVIDAFGIRTKAASIQASEGTKAATEYMISQSKRVTNAMAFAADKTATDFKNMGYAMSYVSTVAKGAGFSIEQTAAAIGVLSNAGVEGSLAGTGLRKTINSLTSPTKGATAALQKYGMTMDDFKTKSGALKSLPNIMRIINKHTKDLGKADKAAFFKAVFGTTGMQAARILADQADAMGKLVKQEKEAEKHDYVGDLAKKQMASTKMQLQLLKTRIQNIGVVLGSELLPAINKVGDAFNDWLKSKNGKETIDALKDSMKALGKASGDSAPVVFNFLGGMVQGIAGVIKVASGFIKAVKGITGWFSKLFGISKHSGDIATFFGKVTGGIIGVIGAIKIFKTIIGGMSAVRQDLKSMFHLDGVTSEKTKIEEENTQLQENIDLWKRHNEVSGGGSALGSEITPSPKEKTTTKGKTTTPEISPTIGNVEKEAPKGRMSRAGSVAGRLFRSGFARSLKGIGNIAVMMITGGVADLDMFIALGKKMVSGIRTGFVKGLSFIKHPLRSLKNFFIAPKEAETQGTKAGSAYSKGVDKGARTTKHGKVTNAFKESEKEASRSGERAGSNFAKSVNRTASQGSKHISARRMFAGTAQEAGEAGTKTGNSFLSKLRINLTRTKSVGAIGKSLGGRIGGAASIALGAVDLFKALGSSNSHNRARKVGKSLGNTVGATGGAAIGASLGSVVPGIGTAIGGLLGGIIGGKLGSAIGEYIGKSWKSIKKGASMIGNFIKKTFGGIFGWIGKQFSKFGKWLDKLGKGSKSKKASPTKATNVSVKDRKLVQQMTKAVRGYTKALQTLKKTKMTKYFSQLSKQLRKSKLNKELAQMDKSTKRSARNWRSLVKPLRQVSNSFKQLQKSMRVLSGKKNGFTTLNRDVRTLYRTLRKNPFGKFISNQARIANKAMGGKKSGFVTNFNRQTRSMTRELRRFGVTFKRDWRNTWNGIGRPVNRGMESAHSALSHNLNAMENKAESFESAFLKGWKSWINQVVSTFKSGFNKLPGYASNAMREIINRLNRGIQGVNSVIDNFGGDKHLSTISYAQGTRLGGHPGGHMLVNDSNRPHWKELVKFPNQPWKIFKERNVLIPNAPAGTQVINGENTHKIMNAMGVHRYAGGTMSEAEQDEMAMEFMDHPQAASKKLLLRMTNWNSKVPVVADLGKAMTIAFSQGIANVLKDLLGIIKEPINGDWTPVIKSAFRVLHLHPQEWQVAKLLRQIQTESGGSETIVNHWDSNARAGHPSQGLLQFIPSTFYSWADPRYRNINKGFDQLVAAIRCLNAGGEGGWGNVGNGHGWATGGIVSAHGLYEMAEGNLPESIIPLDLNKRPRALQVMNHTLDQMESDGGGTGNIRRGDSKEDVQFKRQIISLLGSIAGFSKQQIDAILSIDLDKNSMNRRNNRMKFYNKYGRDQHMADYQRLV